MQWRCCTAQQAEVPADHAEEHQLAGRRHLLALDGDAVQPDGQQRYTRGVQPQLGVRAPLRLPYRKRRRAEGIVGRLLERPLAPRVARLSRHCALFLRLRQRGGGALAARFNRRHQARTDLRLALGLVCVIQQAPARVVDDT